MTEDRYTRLLIAQAKKRKLIFANWRRYAAEIKKFASEMLGSDVEVIIFGSLVRAEHVVGLSDVDVMIVSQKFENPKIKYKLLAELLTRFGDPFEFHLVTPNEKKIYMHFIKREYIEI